MNDDAANAPKCELCGDVMPPGEEMFKYHGFSGPCPAPPKPKEKPEWLLQFFAYGHLPVGLQDVSRPFAELADRMVATLPRNQERTAGLRKLLEAKDCAVRAMVGKEP